MSRTIVSINKIKEDLDRISGLTDCASCHAEFLEKTVHVIVEDLLEKYRIIEDRENE